MFTLAKIKDGSTYLENHLSANDYYAEGEKVIGRWQGKGAERLGLYAEILAGDAAFAALRENRHPVTGEKLTPRDGANRVRFFDFQCSAQKSVSIMAVTLGDDRLLAAHDQASAMAFSELEKFAACQANTVTERNTRNTGNVIAAKFRHTASRALDPQVHTHFVVANATWDEASNGWRALTEYEMVRAIRYAGKVYQNELARSCLALGYDIDATRDERGTITGFEITGVSKEVRERFSKRRAEVETGIAEFKQKHGREPSTAEIHAITVETRSAKLAEITTPAVLQHQREQLTPTELETLTTLRQQAEMQAGQHRGEPNRMLLSKERDSLHASIGHLFERQSVLPTHKILAEALNQNLGRLDLGKLQDEFVQAKLCRLAAGDVAGGLGDLQATRSGLRFEKWAVSFVDRTKDLCPPLCPGDLKLADRLSDEQRNAVALLLATRDQVACLRGAAGVGKTTLLVEMNRAIVESGQRIWHFAPTSAAVDTLRREGLERATTVTDFLQNRLTKDKEALRGGVWVVDEAGLASNKQGAAILRAAELLQARVVFLGDTRQHTSVEAGDFLRVLEQHSKMLRVEVTEIRRQQQREYREAVQLMAAGKAQAGLEKLKALGWVKEAKADYLQAAAEAYVDAVARAGKKVLCVTPTWAENHTATAAIREGLKARRLLADGKPITVHEPLPWTMTQKSKAPQFEPGLVVRFNRSAGGFACGAMVTVESCDKKQVWGRDAYGHERALPLPSGAFAVARPKTIEVSVGDRLLIRANDRTAKFINGETVEVTSVDGGRIGLRDGRNIDPAKFASFSHGYVVTSHKSQSQTVDEVIVAAAQLSAKSAYVACSRGRQRCTVFTPDEKALIARLGSGDRLAALDIGSPREKSPFHKEPREVSRAIQQRSQAWWRLAHERASDWTQHLKRCVGQAWQQGARELNEVVKLIHTQEPTRGQRHERDMS
jgi:conjugative relaxase-like TrwC/TraI family protein